MPDENDSRRMLAVMEGRVACMVPFCRRTAPRAKMPGAIEMLCGKCGRRAPKQRAFWRACERDRKAKEKLGMRLSERGWRRYNRAWDRLVAAAIANPPAPAAPRARRGSLTKPKAATR